MKKAEPTLKEFYDWCVEGDSSVVQANWKFTSKTVVEQFLKSLRAKEEAK